MTHILKEGKEINQLADSFIRNNPNMSKEGLITLMMADPTAVQNNRGSFAGKYAVWIGNLYAQGTIKPGDTPELKRALTTYGKNKSQLPPIKDIPSLLELMHVVKPLRNDFKPSRNISKGEQELEKVYEDNEWIVYIPHTYRASRKIGGDTNWCTASSDSVYFDDYSNQGPLYANIRKSDGAKFQFHFETDSFKDASDESVDLREIGLSKDLIVFYHKIYPYFYSLAVYDWASDTPFDGLTVVESKGKYNFLNNDGELLSPNQWFDYADDFEDGFGIVELNNEYYYIGKNGKLYDYNTKQPIDSLQENKRKNVSQSLNEQLSNNLLLAIDKNLTSLGDNPSIPHISDRSFLEMVIHSEYDSICEDMKSLFTENIPSDSQLESILSKIIKKCQEIEKPYRSELELICGNKLAELFDIPQDSVNISLALVDEITIDTDSVIVDPVDGDQYLQFTGIDSDAEMLRKEIYKRRFLDMLCTGAGLSFSSVISSFVDEIYDINPQLLDFYEKFITINSYLLLSKDCMGINDHDNKLIGTNTVRLGGEDEVVTIEAQGKIFPVLYAESIKGFMELFASHGLPKDTELANEVIGKSDFIKAEPWDMRFGPLIWKSLYLALMENDEDTTLLPYIFQTISRLEPDSFSKFMNGVLIRTSQSQRWIEKIWNIAVKAKRDDDFGQKIEKSKQKSLISDDIYSQEL